MSTFWLLSDRRVGAPHVVNVGEGHGLKANQTLGLMHENQKTWLTSWRKNGKLL